MTNEVTNGSVRFDRVTQDELQKVERLHDEHSKDIDHENKTIAPEDTALNYHKSLLDLDKLLEEQFGEELDKKNDKLTRDFNDGKISLARYQERKMTIDKWLNHSGKQPKKAFSLAVVYMGDEEQTQQKLDALGFDYTIEKLRGEDGNMHNHFHLTDPKQRQQWRKIWADAFREYANAINKKAGIKIFDMTVHMDEASPHCHYKILNCGHSKTGKASYNLTQSLSDFNVSCGRKREYNKVTKKSPKKRLSGKLTMKTTRAVLDKTAVSALNWSLKKNGFSQQWKFEHKGDKAKLTNQMSPKEFKEYKANMKAAQDAYQAVTGQEAVHKDKTPLSPLEMSRGFSKASKGIEKQKKDNEVKEAELAENEQKLNEQVENDKFNSAVRRMFVERLNQQRLTRLRQREKQHEQEIERTVNGAKNQLIDTLVENDPEHVVDSRLLKPNEKPWQVKTDLGRQQHKRQSIKYLTDAVKRSFEKVKEQAKQVVNDFVNDLYNNDTGRDNQNVNKRGSYMLVGTVGPSEHPVNSKKEHALLNDPLWKLKKALLTVSDEAIRKSRQSLVTPKVKDDDKLPGD